MPTQLTLREEGRADILDWACFLQGIKASIEPDKQLAIAARISRPMFWQKGIEGMRAKFGHRGMKISCPKLRRYRPTLYRAANSLVKTPFTG
jgi:hypothetical protein